MNDPASAVVVVVVVLGMMFFLFLIGREIVCWYFKINEMVRLMTGIKDLLTRIAAHTPEATRSSLTTSAE